MKSNGIIYLGGRDKKFRPTLIINAYKMQITDVKLQKLSLLL